MGRHLLPSLFLCPLILQAVLPVWMFLIQSQPKPCCRIPLPLYNLVVNYRPNQGYRHFESMLKIMQLNLDSHCAISTFLNGFRIWPLVFKVGLCTVRLNLNLSHTTCFSPAVFLFFCQSSYLHLKNQH